MPTVRYYDYGVMRMESERRMLDAQRRSGQQSPPYKRVTPESGKQMRPAVGQLSTSPQDVSQNNEFDCRTDKVSDSLYPEKFLSEQKEHKCEQPDNIQLGTARACKDGFQAEELLIGALLLLMISDGKNMPLVLVLLYLLL